MNVRLKLEKLSLSMMFMYIMNRRGERTQPFLSSKLTLKGFAFVLLTQSQTSDCLYNDLTAANS